MLATAGVAPLAVAQSTASKEEEKPLNLEKLVVTGSYIPVAIDSPTVPVAIVNADMITKTGVTTNALDVLKKAVPQFTGNANIGANNANVSSGSTGGGTQASLRNLTTLTLINGRRAAVSPISGQGGNQFVDLNIIPLSSIDTIEVLLDGASATYGSDATSGVINIKTKSNYNGVGLSGFYEWTDQQGKWANRGGNFVFGAGNGKTNITVAGGWSKQDPLWQFERDYSNPQYGTPTYGGVINFGGNYFVLNPAYSAPPVGATKPTITFTGATSSPTSLASIPNAPDGKPYFGKVGSNAYYWGKTTSAGAGVGGFGAGELAFASSDEAEQVAFNLSNYVTILQRREQLGAIITFDHKINDQIEMFGDLLTASIQTFSQINAQPIGTTASFNVGASHVNNPFNNTLRVRNRFVTYPRQYKYDTVFNRGVFGFRGDVNDRVSYETAVNLNRSDLHFRNPGVISSSRALAAAGISPLATSGTTAINMFQRDIPASAVAAANFVGTSYNDFTSELRSWDGRAVIRAYELPAGDLTVVVGGEYRIDQLKGTADLDSIPDFETGAIGWTGATSVNPFSAKRDVTAAFAETNIPLTSPKQAKKGLYKTDLGIAVRHEKYSDTDDPTVPKFTLNWLPFNDEFLVRATYGESFNAPTLYQLFGPSDVGFTPSVTLLPYGLDGNNPDNYVGGQAQLRGGSNPFLRPAESKAHTVGVVWSPKKIKGLVLKATYYKVKESDIVGVTSSQAILQSVEDLGPASPYLAQNAGPNNPVGNFIQPNGKSLYDVRVEGFRSNGDPITAPGQVAGQIDSIYIDRPLVNILSQETDGIDFTAQYKWDIPSVGIIDISNSIAYVLGYDFGGEEIGGRATITGGTIPRWQSYTNFSWERNNFRVFLGHTYVPATKAPDEASTGKTEAEQYNEFDLGVSYTFDGRWWKALNGLKIGLTVKNVGNEAPPQLGDTFPNDSVDTFQYDPIGRRFVISVDYRF